MAAANNDKIPPSPSDRDDSSAEAGIPIGEKVDLEFTEETREPTSNAELREIDPPDEIVSGKIDLGAVMAEFLALGLDPHPRKPGVSFEAVAPEGVAESPFAALGKLKGEP